MDWFLCDNGLRHERVTPDVKGLILSFFETAYRCILGGLQFIINSIQYSNSSENIHRWVDTIRFRDTAIQISYLGWERGIN